MSVPSRILTRGLRRRRHFVFSFCGCVVVARRLEKENFCWVQSIFVHMVQRSRTFCERRIQKVDVLRQVCNRHELLHSTVLQNREARGVLAGCTSLIRHAAAGHSPRISETQLGFISELSKHKLEFVIVETQGMHRNAKVPVGMSQLTQSWWM